MQDFITTTGIVLKTEPIGEYDRRIVILTKDRGKIAAFARGARRQGNRFSATTDLFAFGEFKLYPGRNSYTVSDAVIREFFKELREDLNAALYGMYFLEVMDYQTRENNDEKEMLKLLFQSLRTLVHPAYDNRLIQRIFEIKTMVLMGEYAGLEEGNTYRPGTRYTVDYIVRQKIEKLYNFEVKEEILDELVLVAEREKDKLWKHHFKSEDMLGVLG